MAKVTSISPAGTWTSGDGATFYKYQMTFDDGRHGTIFSKNSSEPHQPGDELSFTINEKGTIKIDRPAYNGGGASAYRKPADDSARSASIIRQVALKAAVEYCNAFIGQGQPIGQDKVLATAQIFNDWMANEKKEVSHAQHMAERVNEVPF